jgi:hypothetical protein
VLDNFIIGKREERRVGQKSSSCFPNIEERKGGKKSIYMLTVFIYAYYFLVGSSCGHISQNK